jgi:hypothetical protein
MVSVTCPRCGQQTARGVIPVWQIIVAICFFPLGLLALLAGRRDPVCQHCGHTWHPQEQGVRRPVFGCLSIVAPFLGFALAVGYGLFHQCFGVDSEGWAFLGGIMLFVPAAFLCSIACGTIGLCRRERQRALSITGIVLGASPLIFVMISLLAD